MTATSPSTTSLSTTPGGPQNVTATGGDGSVTATFDAPADTGNSPITGYSVTLSGPGDYQVTKNVAADAPRSATFSDVTNGSDYTPRVVARNADGSGPAATGAAATPTATATDPGTPPGDTPPATSGQGDAPALHRSGLFVHQNQRGDDSSNESTAFGNKSDLGFVGDWDKVGEDTPGVFRPSNGTFYLRHVDGTVTSAKLGQKGDLPTVGDFDGNGTDTLGYYRPSNATFYLTNDNQKLVPIRFGNRKTHRPVTCDWDGDGTGTIGVVRGTSWYVTDDNAHSDTPFVFTGSAGGEIFGQHLPAADSTPTGGNASSQ